MEGEAWKSEDFLNAIETAFVLEVTDYGLDHGRAGGGRLRARCSALAVSDEREVAVGEVWSKPISVSSIRRPRGTVAVGIALPGWTPVGRPPHRSRRAQLRHRVPTLAEFVNRIETLRAGNY
jgi:hypothetical protein